MGEKLHEVRALYLTDTGQGLTKAYNALKDPTCADQRILELRRLHEEMDRAVLRAYPKLPGVGSSDANVVGWSDIDVPPFCIATEQDQAALQAFEDDVIDRLFVLNEIRAKEEKQQGKKAGSEKKAAAQRKRKTDPNQGTLL